MLDKASKALLFSCLLLLLCCPSLGFEMLELPPFGIEGGVCVRDRGGQSINRLLW